MRTLSGSALRVLFVIFLLCAKLKPILAEHVRMQVQQDHDRLRTALLKHWLDLSSNSALVDAVPIHFHIIKECGFLSHTTLVIPVSRQRWHPSAPSVPIHCRTHQTPGGWSLGPVQTLPLRNQSSRPFASTSFYRIRYHVLCLTHNSDVDSSIAVKFRDTQLEVGCQAI
jgi:hypothetical protein